MDIVLGVSMTPTAVRMVLVEGEKADGVTVDHDTFDITAAEGTATSAADQVVAAILGTRESAVEGGHRLVSTGVTWTDYAGAAELREALTARKIHDVVLVSELHAAGALAQAVGQAVGYERTALMFLERDTATLSVVETAGGAIVKVETKTLHAADAVAEMTTMVAGLEGLEQPPQGLFMVGSGVDVAAVKAQISQGTTLPVHAPEEAELALARGAALASAAAPRYEATTVGLGSVHDGEGTTAGAVYSAGADTEMSAGATQMAAAGYMAPLGYSEVPDEDAGYDAVPADVEDEDDVVEEPGRKPFLLVGSALTSVFVVGVVALVISLAVSIRPTVDQRPNPGEGVIVPSSQAPAPAPQQAQLPAPGPTPAETIQEPVPVVQQAPRTVFVNPAPKAPRTRARRARSGSGSARTRSGSGSAGSRPGGSRSRDPGAHHRSAGHRVAAATAAVPAAARTEVPDVSSTHAEADVHPAADADVHTPADVHAAADLHTSARLHTAADVFGASDVLGPARRRGAE